MAMVAPVVMMPVPVMPAMMTPMAVVPMTVMMPANLHRLHLIDLVLRHDGRLDVGRRGHGRRLGRDRRHRCGLRTCAKQDRARDQASTEIQDIREFHEFKPLFIGEREHMQSRQPKMNGR